MNAPHDKASEEALHHELSGLLKYITRVRQEIATISRPADEEHHFGSMADQLDAVIKATDDASNTIMGCAENNDEILLELRKTVTDPEQLKLMEKISNNGMDIIQACSFQDLTSQRVTKVARSITYVEDRVSALAQVWGKAELDKVEVKGTEKSEDEKLLNGPALDPTQSIDQAAIDALFD
ncbi:MAG: protein phosphatase CheZ [Magnetovibrio sp.]|nr:protein phosphatase CheZ [Magnetovibrio sp.]